MTWQQNLSGVLGSYFSESSFEEGAAEMVFVSEDHLEYHQLWLSAFDEGIQIAVEGSPAEKAELIAIMRYANIGAGTAEHAHDLLEEIRAEYLKQYHLGYAKIASREIRNDRP